MSGRQMVAVFLRSLLCTQTELAAVDLVVPETTGAGSARWSGQTGTNLGEKDSARLN